MSKIAARRVALLASSSLGLAAIASAASLGVALTPTTAAAAVTCVSTPLPTGNGTDDVVFAAGTYNPEITCVYVGDDGLVSTLGAISVSTAAPGGGINLSATGTDDITWNSTAGTVTGGNQTNGPVIEALTQAGNITLTTAGVTGSQATITHGIRAESTGGGAITVTTNGNVSGSGTSGLGAIEAISTGGNGNVIIDAGSSVIGGRLYGILGQASGTGALTISTTFSVDTRNVANDGYAIEAVTGTGLLTINTGGSVANSGGARTGGSLRINTSGNANITGPSFAASAAINPTLDFTMNGAGTLTRFTSTSILTAGSTSITDRVVLLARGPGDLEISANNVRGRIDTSDLAGDLTFGFSGQWLASGQHTFGSGVNVVTVAPGGVIPPEFL